jgi:hypothetical protein
MEFPSRKIMPASCAKSWPDSPTANYPAGGFEPDDLRETLAPWIGRFFADLENAEAAQFYRRVGALGRVFIEIEAEAFALAS